MPKKMTANLFTLVTTINDVAAIMCCSRIPAYEMATPLTHESATKQNAVRSISPNLVAHCVCSPLRTARRRVGSSPTPLLSSIIIGFERSTGLLAIRWRCMIRSRTAKSMLTRIATSAPAEKVISCDS
jgi:hypothetical protein